MLPRSLQCVIDQKQLLLKVEGAGLARSVVAGLQDAESPEGCFLTAIEIARRQEGKSLELRSTVSLARLWQQQGQNDEARHIRAAIYGWFTEGFDTVDLQQAKALLEELSAMDMAPDGDQRYG